jgi:hypothetical protein
MEAMPPSPDVRQSEPPLWSIGLAVAIILIAPLVLYSLAPTGPLRVGDTIFSDGQQRVTIADSGGPHPGNDDTCLLDPDHPLIIIQRASDRPDGTVLAQVQGNPTGEWPFCPPLTAVLVRSHQMFQRPDLLRGLKAKGVALMGESEAVRR